MIHLLKKNRKRRKKRKRRRKRKIKSSQKPLRKNLRNHKEKNLKRKRVYSKGKIKRALPMFFLCLMMNRKWAKMMNKN